MSESQTGIEIRNLISENYGNYLRIIGRLESSEESPREIFKFGSDGSHKVR
jgi:hypothetical protein